MDRQGELGNEWLLTELMGRFMVLAADYRSSLRRNQSDEWVGTLALLSGWDDMGSWQIRLQLVPPFIECCDDVRCWIGDDTFFDALMVLRHAAGSPISARGGLSEGGSEGGVAPDNSLQASWPVEIRVGQVVFTGGVEVESVSTRTSRVRLSWAERAISRAKGPKE